MTTRNPSPLARLAAAAFVTTLTFAAVPALADDEIDASSKRAEELAASAFVEGEHGNWQKAIELYLAAYEAQPAAVVLYDIAVVYDRKLGTPNLAMQYYARASQASDVEPAIATECKKRLAELSPQTPLPKPRPTEPDPKPVTTRWHPLKYAAAGSVIGGAIALTATGILAGMALGKESDADAQCDGDRCTDPAGFDASDKAQTYASIASVTFIVGAALVATGAVLWFSAPKDKAKTASVIANGLHFRW